MATHVVETVNLRKTYVLGKVPVNALQGVNLKVEKGDFLTILGPSKVFDDKVRTVDGISFSVKEGEVLGFLGPNVAGKKGLYLTLRCFPDTYTQIGCG